MRLILLFALLSCIVLIACSGDLAGQAINQLPTDEYAPPVDVYENNQQIFFVEKSGEDQQSFRYTIRVDHTNGVVQNTGHYYTNQWYEFAFPQQEILDQLGNPSGYIASPAETTITLSKQQHPMGLQGVLANSCKEQNGLLSCSCKGLGDCGYWMFQSVESGARCTSNTDCSGQCINSACGDLSDLYSQQQCAQTCKLKTITVVTSNGETHLAGPGGGSYTSAGALTWVVESGPEHCATQETIVPIKIIKKNYGEIVTEEYITLKRGETSQILHHPTISSVAFTLNVQDVTRECS
jgi:hypothetical protein